MNINFLKFLLDVLKRVRKEKVWDEKKEKE